MISVSVKEFQTYSVPISDDLKDRDWRGHHAWIVYARFNPLHFINYVPVFGT